MARSEAMSDRYLPDATVCVEAPFQARVQEVLPRDCRKARVRYFAPDACAVAVMPSVVQVSKYGAYTRAGSAVAAETVDPPNPTTTASDAPTSNARVRSPAMPKTPFNPSACRSSPGIRESG